MTTNDQSIPVRVQPVVGTQGEIICCDVCGERIGKNLTGYAWRTHRAICGLCLDDAVNAIGKYFPKLERPNESSSPTAADGIGGAERNDGKI